MVLFVIVQSVFTFLDLSRNPTYDQLPTTYDYVYEKEFDINVKTNMMAYSISSVVSADYSFKYVRFYFLDGNNTVVNAVLCKDYYAAEIQAGWDHASNSSFYTETYKR